MTFLLPSAEVSESQNKELHDLQNRLDDLVTKNESRGKLRLSLLLIVKVTTFKKN